MAVSRASATSWANEGALLALGLGLALGVIWGTSSAWPYFAAGFPAVAARALAGRVNVANLITAAAVAIFVTVFVGLQRRLGRPAASIVGAALACLGPFLAAGARFNRQRGLSPGDLFSAPGIAANLPLLGLLAVAFALLAAGGAAWSRRLGSPDRAPRLRTSWRAVGLAALLAIVNLIPRALAGASDRTAGRPPVLLLVVDALRADHVAAYGYARPTTPAIDALAKDAVLFRQAISQSTFTKTSVASLLTGRFPYEHGVYWGSRREGPGRITSDVLAATETTLPEVLEAHGYLSAAWVQNTQLRSFMGFDQGFVAYHDQQGDIAEIHDRFLDWVAGPAGRQSFFAYLHYIDLHDPYRPEPPYDTLFGDGSRAYRDVDFAEWGRYLEEVRQGRRRVGPAEVAALKALYDGQLRYVDEQIGRLLAALAERGLYEESLIVVTSDHGDAFLEHGDISHSNDPYDEVLRVPLLIKLPGGRFGGRVVPEQVRLTDVMPTVLDVLGLPVPEAVSGCSLVPLARGASPRIEARPDHCRIAIAEIAREGSYPIVAIRTGRQKYIHHEKHPDELYDLEADPGETRNLARAGGAQAGGELARLRRLALEVVARRGEETGGRVLLDDQAIRELKALGYLP